MNTRCCSRTACKKPPVYTLTYVYRDSTAVLGPLAVSVDPHSWDLCEMHAGRLVVPFTMAMNATIGQGVMAKIVRSGGVYSTELVTPVAIYSGGSLRDATLEPQMLKGLTTGGLRRLKSVRRDAHERGETCVIHGREVCLSLAEAK